MVLLFLLFFNCLVFCNEIKHEKDLKRRELSLRDARKGNPFLALAYDARSGNLLAEKVYYAYSDILANKRKPRYIDNPDVVKKLLALNLCDKVGNKLHLKSFFIEDRCFDLRKKK